jgi:DNA-binding NarL/FixJ family response regulator
MRCGRRPYHDINNRLPSPRRALEAGASGFVVKHSAPVELLMAIRAALEGKTFITPALAGEVRPGSVLRAPVSLLEASESLTSRYLQPSRPSKADRVSVKRS